MRKRERYIWLLYCLAVFGLLFAFFFAIHPLVLFDSDDWTYVAYARPAIPLWGDWNPTRVFPEVFMPLCGSIAAHLVRPLMGGDYIGALALVFAAALSLFITGYACLFGKVMRERCGLSSGAAVLWTTMFLLLHFLILRSKYSYNEHLFLASSATRCFFYTIPDILNCGLVLYLLLDDALDDGWRKLRAGVYGEHPLRYGLLALAIYMALFSNLYASVILAAYVGCQLLGELARLLRGRTRLGECLRGNSFRLAYIALWGGVQVFEANGGRAKALLETAALSEQLKAALRACAELLRSFNRCFLALAILLPLAAAILACRGRGSKRAPGGEGERAGSVPLRLLSAGVLIGAYEVLMSAVAASGYIVAPEVMFGAAFCLLMEMALCGAYVLKRLPWTALALPLAICVVLSEIDTGDRVFMESNKGYLDSETCVAVSEDIVRQFTEAEARGDAEVALRVPRFDNPDNWPIAAYAAGNIPRALYKHGVLRAPVALGEFIPTEEKNAEFGIPVPGAADAPLPEE